MTATQKSHQASPSAASSFVLDRATLIALVGSSVCSAALLLNIVVTILCTAIDFLQSPIGVKNQFRGVSGLMQLADATRMPIIVASIAVSIVAWSLIKVQDRWDSRQQSS